jgi:hypothetical protein
MYTPGGVAVAIRGVGGRWGSRCGRFRYGPTVLLPQRRVLLPLLHDPLLHDPLLHDPLLCHRHVSHDDSRAASPEPL